MKRWIAPLIFLTVVGCDNNDSVIAARRPQCPVCPTCPPPVVCPVPVPIIGAERVVEEEALLSKYSVNGRYSVVGWRGTVTDQGVTGFTKTTTAPTIGQYQYLSNGIYQFNTGDVNKTVTIIYRLK